MGKFDKDIFGNRQKKYEEVFRQKLVFGEPIVIRCDGKAFHNVCKKMKKPFDDFFINTMQKAMFWSAKDIQNCKLGYVQSDEITFVCIIDDIMKTEAFYDNEVSKIISIISSKVTKNFIKAFYENLYALKLNPNLFKEVVNIKIYEDKLFETEFDCRVMNIPKWDTLNNVIWQQQDASRNSILLLGQSYFTHDELYKKNLSQIQDMLMLQKGINWNDLETYKKRGTCCYKKEIKILNKKTNQMKTKSKWYLDLDMPILTEPNAREYFNNILFGNQKEC